MGRHARLGAMSLVQMLSRDLLRLICFLVPSASLLFVGGSVRDVTCVTELSLRLPLKWSPLPPFPEELKGGALAFYADRCELWLVGWRKSADAHVVPPLYYSFDERMWRRPKEDMPDVCMSLRRAAVVIWRDFLILLGGKVAEDSVFDLKQMQVVKNFLPDRPSRFHIHQSAFLFGNLLFSLGISDPTDWRDIGALHDLCFLDLTTVRNKIRPATWERLPSQDDFKHAAFFVHNGRLWIAGGIRPSHYPADIYPTRACWSIDLRQDGTISWTEEPPLPWMGTGLAAVPFRGGILVTGGDGERNEHRFPLPYVVFLNAEGTQWSTIDRVTGGSLGYSEKMLPLWSPMHHLTQISDEVIQASSEDKDAWRDARRLLVPEPAIGGTVCLIWTRRM